MSSADGIDSAMGIFDGGKIIATSLISLVVGIVAIIAMIKLYKKFGKPGWVSIVPIYNTWVLFQMGGLPGWLCLIPFVNTFCLLAAYFRIVKKLGKSTGFAVCTILFFPICTLIMGFDKSIVVEQGTNNNYNNQNMNNQSQMNNNQLTMNNQQAVPQDQIVKMNSEVATQPVNEAPASIFASSEPTTQTMLQQEVPNVGEPPIASVDNSNNIQ